MYSDTVCLGTKIITFRFYTGSLWTLHLHIVINAGRTGIGHQRYLFMYGRTAENLSTFACLKHTVIVVVLLRWSGGRLLDYQSRGQWFNPTYRHYET